MGTDLPDWYTQVQSVTLRATSIAGGIDADKSASPVAEDVYLARDTGILYVCFVSGTWTNIGTLYLLKAGGTMSGAIAMGSNKITGLAAPTASADAARKSEVDAVSALLDDVTQAQPTRLVDTIYQNTGGKLRLVTITGIIAGGEVATILCAATTPPATIIGRLTQDDAGTVDYMSVTFLVPVNWYYLFETTTSTPGIYKWTEWDLF